MKRTIMMVTLLCCGSILQAAMVKLQNATDRNVGIEISFKNNNGSSRIRPMVLDPQSGVSIDFSKLISNDRCITEISAYGFGRQAMMRPDGSADILRGQKARYSVKDGCLSDTDRVQELVIQYNDDNNLAIQSAPQGIQARGLINLNELIKDFFE